MPSTDESIAHIEYKLRQLGGLAGLISQVGFLVRRAAIGHAAP